MTAKVQYQHFRTSLKISCWMSVLMLRCYFAQGQEYKCEVEFTGKCISKVTWKIPEKYAHRKTPFTVSYMSSEGKTGRYYCEAAGGHVCDDDSNSTSIVSNSATTCVTDRAYILAADGEDHVTCVNTLSQTDSSGSHSDNRKQNDTSCCNDTFYNTESFIGVTAGTACAVIILLLLTLVAVVTRRGRWKFTKQSKVPPTDPQVEEAREDTNMLDHQKA